MSGAQLRVNCFGVFNPVDEHDSEILRRNITLAVFTGYEFIRCGLIITCPFPRFDYRQRSDVRPLEITSVVTSSHLLPITTKV